MRLLRSFFAFAALLYLTAALALTPGKRIVLFSGVKPLVSYDLTASNTLPAGISYSATSLRTELDSNGFITYAPNNLLTQSNTFSNAAWTKTNIGSIVQGATDPFGGSTAWTMTDNSSNAVHFIDQGASSANNQIHAIYAKAGTASFASIGQGGTLYAVFDLGAGTVSSQTGVVANITSAGNGWYLISVAYQPPSNSFFEIYMGTTAANTGPNKVYSGTGSTILIADAVQSAVTYETSPRSGDQVITTSSAYYGPAFDSNYPSAGYQGLRSWEQYTNVDLWNRDLTNAVWTATNITAAHNQTGIDNVANSASSLTATANNGTICQPVTLASSKRQQAIYVKRLSGTGAVSLSMDGGATYTALTVTVSWGHQSIPAQTLANPQTCIKLATGGDSIAVDGVQNDNASAPLAPVAFTTSTAVAVSADLPQASGVLAACLKANSMSAAYEFVFNAPLSTFPTIISNNTNSRLFAVLNSNFLYLSDGTNVIRTANSTTLGSVMRGAASIIGSNSGAISLNGGAVATGSGDSFTSGSTFYLGSKGGSTNFIDGPLRKISCWSPALPNNLLPQKSTVGPGPITWLIPENNNFAIDERRKAA